MPTLVYKRTHRDDPDKSGIFGIYNCMGRVRTYAFDSVIAIGGIGRWAKEEDIDGRINWIGVGAHPVGWCLDGPLLAFERFVLFNERGPSVFKKAPLLAERFCGSHPARFAIYAFDAEEKAEIKRLLALARRARASKVNRKTAICRVKKLAECTPKRPPKQC